MHNWEGVCGGCDQVLLVIVLHGNLSNIVAELMMSVVGV